MSEFDQYYTPASVARRLIEALDLPAQASICADPTCGSGSLLMACETVLPGVACAGIDRDAEVIRRLKRANPHWQLSAADLLCDRSIRSTTVYKALPPVDLLALNPPFTQSKGKFVELTFGGEPMRASTAMGYVLRSLSIFQPRFGAVAILPESLLYADIDREARDAIGKRFSIRQLFELRSTAFSGARARTIAVQISPSARRSSVAEKARLQASGELIMSRGSVPLHDNRVGLEGFPLIHTTDLAALAVGNYRGKRFCAIDNKAVAGWRLLLPRVGLPKKAAVGPIFLRRRSVLSDCVIGLGADVQTLERAAAVIRGNWKDFLALYRGTGARYVTVNRLTSWFESIGFVVLR